MLTLKRLCEAAVNSKVREYRYHAVWGNPMWGMQDEWFVTEGNMPILTRTGRKRSNAAIMVEKRQPELANNDYPVVYDVHVNAYSITIATLFVYVHEDATYVTIVKAKVTSRTDITILSDVARMLDEMGVRVNVLVKPYDSTRFERPTYESFKRVAIENEDYQPTGNYVW